MKEALPYMMWAAIGALSVIAGICFIVPQNSNNPAITHAPTPLAADYPRHAVVITHIIGHTLVDGHDVPWEVKIYEMKGEQ